MALSRNEKELLQEYRKSYNRSKNFIKLYLIVFIIIIIIGLILTIVNISNEINAYFILGLVALGSGILFTITALLCLRYINRKLKKFNNTEEATD
ncbi:MAG: hypothetical protein WC292_02435 [Clostridia bacterium]